jgi:hypothetical protein
MAVLKRQIEDLESGAYEPLTADAIQCLPQ